MSNPAVKFMERDGHTVTNLEAHAVILWAKSALDILEASLPEWSEKEQHDIKVVLGYLYGASKETEEGMMKNVLAAKLAAVNRGECPMSAEAMPVH